MRADRLLRMMFLLQKNKQMRAKDLATELEVSLSTVYRDIDALSVAGIPVYAQPGTNGGIFIEEGFRAALTGLSGNQIASLFLAINAKSLADIGMEGTTTDALLRLFNALPSSGQDEVRRNQQRLYIDPEGWFDNSNSPHIMSVLQQAVWQDQRVKMLYQPQGKPHYELTVDAYALVSKAQHWYFVGRGQTGDYRAYRASRMIDASQCDTPFERDMSFNLVQYWQSVQQQFQQQSQDEFPAFTVVLRVHNSAFWYLIRVLERQFEVLAPPDDRHWSEVRIEFNTVKEATAHILALADQVEIVTPKYLKADLKVVAEAASEHYNT